MLQLIESGRHIELQWLINLKPHTRRLFRVNLITTTTPQPLERQTASRFLAGPDGARCSSNSLSQSQKQLDYMDYLGSDGQQNERQREPTSKNIQHQGICWLSPTQLLVWSLPVQRWESGRDPEVLR